VTVPPVATAGRRSKPSRGGGTDGTAKGGILYSLQQQLDIPVKLVGVGEQVTDFAFFSPEEFAKGLVAYRK
jgi:signal recognition particle GTPase